ncbi:GntR family transcriptional regulator [Streptomyces scabiei]
MRVPIEAVETKSDLAYRQVRDRILSGELEPGSVIQQRELARSIGISTTPLREALRRLKGEGLVDLDAHRDARVAPLRAEEARDLLELRRSLDRWPRHWRPNGAPRPTSAPSAPRRTGWPRSLRTRASGSWWLIDASTRRSTRPPTTTCSSGRWSPCGTRPTAIGAWRSVPTGDRRPGPEGQEHDLLVECVALGDSAGAEEIMRGHIDTSLGATAVRRLGHAGSAASVREG